MSDEDPKGDGSPAPEDGRNLDRRSVIRGALAGAVGTAAAFNPAVKAMASASLTGSCTLVRFEVPTNSNPAGLASCRAKSPSGRGASFNMEADFAGDCGCCSFRQCVAGFFSINGTILPHMLHTYNPPDHLPLVLLSPTVCQEDSFVPFMGIRPHYGRRDEVGDAFDVYDQPDRACGCRYRGFDFPGLVNLQNGDEYVISLSFEGRIIDTCTSQSKDFKAWTVMCSGTYPN